MRGLLRAGVEKVSINTAAISNPSVIAAGADVFGGQAIVVAIDARRNPGGGWLVYTHGGRRATELDAIEWAHRAAELGAGELLVTSMDRDGTRDGYDLELLEAIARVVNIPVIASGGAGNLDHLAEGLAPGRADAVLAASIFHFGEFRIAQAKRHLADRGIPVRL
jgi:cyclase